MEENEVPCEVILHSVNLSLLCLRSHQCIWFGGCLDLIESPNYNEAPIVLAGVDRHGVLNI